MSKTPILPSVPAFSVAQLKLMLGRNDIDCEILKICGNGYAQFGKFKYPVQVYADQGDSDFMKLNFPPWKDCNNLVEVSCLIEGKQVTYSANLLIKKTQEQKDVEMKQAEHFWSDERNFSLHTTERVCKELTEKFQPEYNMTGFSLHVGSLVSHSDVFILNY